MNAAPGARRAFTLIEVLVVISVVSLLGAIMLPSLAGARNAGRAAACLNRLRQLGLEVHAYAGDHAEALPRSQHSALAYHAEPWEYTLGESISGIASRQLGSAPEAWDALVLAHYRCPLDRREPGISYGINVYYELSREETGGPTWGRLSLPPRAWATVLFGELGGVPGADHIMAHFWTQFQAPPEVAVDRHRPGEGYVYLDGHAATARFISVFDPSQDLDQWNPAVAR